MINFLQYWVCFVLVLAVLFLVSCQQNQTQGVLNSTTNEVVLEQKPLKVEYYVLDKDIFMKEILSNGKLVASKKADLKFASEGIIEGVYVRKGELVRTGQVIMSLNKEQQEIYMAESQLRYEKAILDYEDQLLRQGYKLIDTLKLSKDIIHVAKIRSGLADAQLQLKRSEMDLQSRRLIAPYAGVVANLKAKPSNSSNQYDFVCTILDNSQLQVEFKVLANELEFLRNSTDLVIKMFANPASNYTGKISGINPLVDDGGMISVIGTVNNPRMQLMHGMDVQIVIRKEVKDQLIVPKTAVLDRQDRKVVFTFNCNLPLARYIQN